MTTKKIAIASDHAGFITKSIVLGYLREMGHDVNDLGAYNEGPADYPDYGHKLARELDGGTYSCGIAVCGSGNGINMSLNRHSHIRAALCWNVEISKLSRQHNNANVCTLPGRFVTKDEAIAIVSAFLDTSFEGGRHELRVCKINL